MLLPTAHRNTGDDNKHHPAEKYYQQRNTTSRRTTTTTSGCAQPASTTTSNTGSEHGGGDITKQVGTNNMLRSLAGHPIRKQQHLSYQENTGGQYAKTTALYYKRYYTQVKHPPPLITRGLYCRKQLGSRAEKQEVGW